MNVGECRIVNLPKIAEEKGHLSFIEEFKHIPFAIKRVYYISNVPNGSTRGGHANPNTEHMIIALNGRFRVRVRDTHTEKVFVLERSDCGLYLPKGIWHQVEECSEGSIVLVLASSLYDEKDYVRN